MTSYQTVPISIIQSENKSRSRQFSSSSLVNMYIDVQEAGRTTAALMPWPGEPLFSAGTTGKARGSRVVDGVLYIVSARKLIKVNSDGSQVVLSDIAGVGRVSIADDGFNLLIRVRGTAAFINGKFILQGNGVSYLWNGNTLAVLTLPELTNDDEFLVSDVNNPTNYRSQNIGNAILKGDALKQVYVFQRKIIMAGETSIEFYNDEGTGNPPIQPITQASTTQIGVASPFSMAETPSYLYFLGNDGVVYRLINFSIQSITMSAIAKEIREGDYSDAVGHCCQLDGQWFYILQLEKANKTLVYSESGNYWLRLSSGTNLDRHFLSGYAFAYNKHLVIDAKTSNVYEWDFHEYTSNGKPIIRQFDTVPMNGLAVGAGGKRIAMSKAVFIMQTATGNDANIDPKIMVSASYDGMSFDDEVWCKIGRPSESTNLVHFYNCATFYDLILRVRISDPVFASFHGATIDVRTVGY